MIKFFRSMTDIVKKIYIGISTCVETLLMELSFYAILPITLYILYFLMVEFNIYRVFTGIAVLLTIIYLNKSLQRG